MIVIIIIFDRDFFGKPLNDHIDPDVTVAYGAASILDWHNRTGKEEKREKGRE